MDIFGSLSVGYDKSNEEDESALVVMRRNGDKFELLKAEIGEQADILYRLLTEQMTKAEIKENTV